MGVNSEIHRYREAGEAANVNNVARFGEPVRSLFTSTKVLTLHHHIDITDAEENMVYEANTKVISLHDTTDITDRAGAQVAHIERKIMTIHQKHTVSMADGIEFVLSTELLHIINSVTNIEGLGWQLKGNVLQLNFELYDKDGSIIAVISQKMLSMHDKYCMDIYKPEYEKIVVAILVAVQHMVVDKNRTAASASTSY